MRFRTLTFFALSFLILPSLAASAVIANSYDWRDVFVIMLYSYYTNNSFHFVNSLGEAKILSMTLNRSEDQLIFESSTNSVVKNFQSFLKLRGFKRVSSTHFSDYKSLQFSLYSLVRKKIKGHV